MLAALNEKMPAVMHLLFFFFFLAARNTVRQHAIITVLAANILAAAIARIKAHWRLSLRFLSFSSFALRG